MMAENELRQLAKAIVEDICRSGYDGHEADRLVLCDDTLKQGLGGWGRGPLEDRIYGHLQRMLGDKE